MQPGISVNGADDGNAGRFKRVADHVFVARTAELVQDDARYFHFRIVPGEAFQDGCSRLSL